MNYAPEAIVYHKRRGKVSELPEAFFSYLYWQYLLDNEIRRCHRFFL